jgi:hypothetical protein
VSIHFLQSLFERNPGILHDVVGPDVPGRDDTDVQSIREGPKGELSPAPEDNQVVQDGHVREDGGDQVRKGLALLRIARRLCGIAREGVGQLVAVANDFIDLGRSYQRETKAGGHFVGDDLAPAAILM